MDGSANVSGRSRRLVPLVAMATVVAAVVMRGEFRRSLFVRSRSRRTRTSLVTTALAVLGSLVLASPAFALATPQIVTTATQTATLGQPITDTATLSGTVDPRPSTIFFTLFGPGNPTCTGTPVFTSTVPVSGNGNYTSGPFTPTAAGTYNWVATYTGDPNNVPVTSTCGAANETSTVTAATPTIFTEATSTATVGQPITDIAALPGASDPSGTITFTVFGPSNPTCTGAGVFTSTVPVSGNGYYMSAPFTPTAAGTYNWVATYSGDANNYPATSRCDDPLETTTVTSAPTNIVTQATSTAGVGQPITDTATLSGGSSPSGTITFTVFGPSNPTCTGAPLFTSTVPVSGNGNYISNPPFTPTAAGTYNWVAAYSGDVNNAPVTSACGAPNETTTVTAAADLSITKACTPGVALPGDTVDCTLSVTNAGPSDAQDVTVTDSLPAEQTVVGTPGGGGFSCDTVGSPEVITCTKETQPAGQTSEITYTVQVASDTPLGTSMDNTATVSSSTTPDSDPDDNTATATVATPTCTIDNRGSGGGEIVGTNGPDVICGSPYADEIDGEGGNDLIFGFGGDDEIKGGAGRDRMFGGTGNDEIKGDKGNDLADGGRGQDECRAERRTSCER